MWPDSPKVLVIVYIVAKTFLLCVFGSVVLEIQFSHRNLNLHVY